MGIFDTLLGKDAANASRQAAADTYGKQQRAIGDLTAFGDQYAGKFADLSQAYSPYASGGNAALEQLLAGLGLGGNQQAFTQAYRALPGYQAGLDTGSRAITGNAAAHGMLDSGKTLKALQRFGSDYEDQRSGDYLSRLMGLVGMGQNATGQQVATQAQGLQGQLGTRQSAYGGAMNAAGTIGQGDIAAANAKSAGLQNILNLGANLAGKAMSFGVG